jgi:hypothetical protein
MSDEPSTEVLIASGDPSMRALATALRAEGIASRTVSSPEEAQRFAERTARFLKIADAVGYTHKIALILNRANSGVRGELLEQHLEMQVAASVVSAGRLAVDSANQGRPLLLDDTEGREEIARNLARVVELVAGEARQPAAVSHRPAASFLKGRGQLSGLAFWRGGGR